MLLMIIVAGLTTRVLPKLAQPSYRKMLVRHLVACWFGNNLCQAKSVVGSPDYMSPEVTAGRRVSVQEGYGEEVDWWSLGCVFFEMILGAPPFQVILRLVYKNWHVCNSDDRAILQTRFLRTLTIGVRSFPTPWNSTKNIWVPNFSVLSKGLYFTIRNFSVSRLTRL